MPPGPAYNWYCVAHSVLDVLSQAARIRATQLEQQSSRVLTRGTVQTARKSTRKNEEYGPNLILLGNTSTNVPDGLAHRVGQATIQSDERQDVAPEQHPTPPFLKKTGIRPASNPIPRPVHQIILEPTEPQPNPEMAPVEQDVLAEPSAATLPGKPVSKVRIF